MRKNGEFCREVAQHDVMKRAERRNVAQERNEFVERLGWEDVVDCGVKRSSLVALLLKMGWRQP